MSSNTGTPTNSTTSASATDPERRRRLLILVTCCMSLFIVGLDNTILNVALPSVRSDLGASVSGLQWTTDAYTLVLAGLLMLAGSTADRIGRRRVFKTGLVLFALGSLLCGIAPSLEWLIAFRVVQAVGGSMLNPVAMSIITNTFTEPRERARAIGVWGAVVGISMALGPIVGGALVQSAGWRSVFWVNLPVALVAFVLTMRFVPESRAPRPRRADPIGQVLVILTLVTLTAGVIEGPGRGWDSPEIIALFAVAALSLVALLRYEPRRDEPLIDLRFFRSVPFSGATVIAVCAFSAMSGFLFLNTLYLQEVRGYSPIEAGLHTLPMAVATMAFSPLSGRLVGTVGARVPLLVAGFAITISGLLLTGLDADTPVALLIVAYTVFGIGFGMVNAPITNTAVSGMPRAQAGVAAAVASTSRQVGQSLGVAVVGSTMAAALAGGGVGGQAAHLAGATHTGWWIVAGCGVAIGVLGIITTGRRARASATRTAAELQPEPPVSAPDPAKVANITS
ncbi:MFS transporter [Streptomyces sp. SID3343]|uniref:MFS transporter n=1 Tax=Streptomyces sp. SID3343 TaxID=2690260 RepID=UPI00136A720E|nr:MFS transporter [Streptomyces sp. SID3343]MYW04361.1 DHA2 family efflux MFS transporter permease subunit [Streptomyces sp. SID3343]